MTISFTKINLLRKTSQAFLLFFCLNISFNAHAFSEYQTVLVSSKNSTITMMSNRDIRRIFLGLRPINSSTIQIPLINESNNKNYKLFLKNIMFLTERGYKRKLLKRVFRQGADKIDSFNSIKKLVLQLKSNPDHISFMSKEDALKHSELKIIQTLW